MAKSPEQSFLISLIAAGAKARQILAEPLAELGLSAGDDAIIFALNKKVAISDEDLAAQTGLIAPQLLPRLERLINLQLIERSHNQEIATSASRLTAKGQHVFDLLHQNLKKAEIDFFANGQPANSHQSKTHKSKTKTNKTKSVSTKSHKKRKKWLMNLLEHFAFD